MAGEKSIVLTSIKTRCIPSVSCHPTNFAPKSIALFGNFQEFNDTSPTMLFPIKSCLVLLSAYVGICVASAIPVAEPVPAPAAGPDPMAQMSPSFGGLLAPRASRRPPHNPNCPSTVPVSQNVCTSGSPYCCEGTGPGAVCGPSSTTNCASTVICCINTNGVS